ncbi:MAG: hypothetical protein A2167_08890 [Planctomycetes bacterium RBG_13_46_10]|nr:MAG: hypothetical protein A2167_08890 [Planctomycetes bacterium RBG_13_46_10]
MKKIKKAACQGSRKNRIVDEGYPKNRRLSSTNFKNIICPRKIPISPANRVVNPDIDGPILYEN